MRISVRYQMRPIVFLFPSHTQMKKKFIGKLSTACFGFAIHNIRTINFVLEFSLFDDNSFVSTKYDYNSQDVQLFICDE